MSKSKDDVAAKHILQYLIDQNRPYSVIDIFNNLHKEHGKTVVGRAVEQLASEQKIVEKTYGKQKIYFSNQNDLPEASESDVQAMDSEINNLNEQLRSVNREIKELEKLEGSLIHSLTTEEVKKSLEVIKKEILLLQEKLKSLQSRKILVNPEEKKKLYSSKDKCYGACQKRKRIANYMLDAILENYPNGKQQLCEEIGVETE